MVTAEDNQHHHHHHPQGPWYPPEPPVHVMHAKQQSFYRPPLPNHYPHHLGQMHPQFAVPYGHQHHPYHYPLGPEEHVEDSNTPSGYNSNRRDSFPYYHQYHPPQQATPLQPPPNTYNGPPVSALVPRFPRGPTQMYSHGGYTPHTIYYDSLNHNSVSSCPPSTGDQKDSTNHSRSIMHSKNRRTSFGLPTISSYPNFLIPTPQHSSSTDGNDTSSEASSTVIPAPPSNEKDSDSNVDTANSEYLKQESRCVNLLSKKFSTPKEDLVTFSPKEAPTVQDASLLLGLTVSSDSSSDNSPATVPTLQDESEPSEEPIIGQEPHNQDIPKTCFPVPIPTNYPKRLALPNDTVKLNALHCFIRTDLLEIFVVEPSPEALKFRHAPSSSVGRVGFRCVHCVQSRNNAMNAARDDEAPMSVFFPKNVSEIYRLVTSWQRCHVRKCKNLPKDVREKWYSLRETEKCRGKTVYWVDSAKKIGLVDCPSRMGGIRFDIKNVEDTMVAVKEEEDEDYINSTQVAVKEEDLTDAPSTTDENSKPLSLINISSTMDSSKSADMNKDKKTLVTASPSNRNNTNFALSTLSSSKTVSNL